MNIALYSSYVQLEVFYVKYAKNPFHHETDFSIDTVSPNPSRKEASGSVKIIAQAMYFTNGDHRTFESLMRDNPNHHFDSSAEGQFPECWSFRCYRLYRKGLMV